MYLNLSVFVIYTGRVSSISKCGKSSKCQEADEASINVFNFYATLSTYILKNNNVSLTKQIIVFALIFTCIIRFMNN